MSFFTILAIVFIVLKLCGIIFWSWWLVLLPLYGGAALVLFIFLVGIIATLVSGAISSGGKYKRR